MYLEGEYVLVSLSVYDFDKQQNLDLWQELREVIASHPLRKDEEALRHFINEEAAALGHWWRSAEVWRGHTK